MAITASKLRENVYKILDRVLKTGIPVEINRRGKTLKMVPSDDKSKLANIKKHDIPAVDPQNIVHMDWSDEWKGYFIWTPVRWSGFMPVT